METERIYGEYFEELIIGKMYKHPLCKTITESDNNLFCLLTMNHHPIHSNIVFAQKSQYGQILVVGTYVFSLVVGMSVCDISGKAIANLDYEKVIHNGPVFIGDTINAETEILEKKLSETKDDRGIIYVETRAYNQNSEKILTLRRHILVPKKY